MEQEAGAAAQEREEISRLTWQQEREEKDLALGSGSCWLDTAGEEKRGNMDVLWAFGQSWWCC